MTLMSGKFPTAFILALSLGLMACDDTDDLPPDAGLPPADAGDTGDAGDLPDGGEPADAGETGDGGAEPIEELANDTWTWVDFPDSRCRDGSATGIGINPHEGATGLVIFLEGGGACFNSTTCSGNPARFGQTEFGTGRSTGIFDRTNTSNPLRDWNFVFVPYCTGDVHAGNNPAGNVVGVAGLQHFVGYANMAKFLERLKPTFTPTQVLLTGSSAGGFGAAANYLQVAEAFSPVAVDLLDDSGPFMRAPTLPQCLQDAWIDLWNFDETFLGDCGSECEVEDDPFFTYLQTMTERYPESTFGLVSSVGDQTIRQFFGFGASSCSSFAPVSEADFQTGLLDIRSGLSEQENYGDYLFPGTEHTTLGASFSTRSVGGELLSDWVSDLIEGTMSTVGP